MIAIRNKWAATLLAATLLATGIAARAQALPDHAVSTTEAPAPGTVNQTWQMLDYLATDYAGAVRDGQVSSASEYAEMREFAGTVRQRLAQLPARSASPALERQATRLVELIDAKAGAPDVAAQAHALADALLAAYPVATAPAHAPDLARGAALYRQTCAACHGAGGHGDGPAGVALEPRPIDFTDRVRADQRSALSLFEAISQGVKGTAMTGYATQLPVEDRWSLAYYVGTLAYSGLADQGARAWQHDAAARARLGKLDELSRARVAQLAPALGARQAQAILGYLRAHPDALPASDSGLALAREKLAASLEAWRRGRSDDAQQLALSAYLDGVEPVEPQLDARDAALRAQLETAMGAYRTAVYGTTTATDVLARQRAADLLLQRAQATLAGGAANAASTFVGAWTILVREGLEALLVVVALLAFLRKAAQPAMVRYVHAGWGLALLAGLATWAIASYAIAISGAGRELTEGLSSLFAAVVLLCVGLWMHRKSVGGRWQAYLKAKMADALDRRSAWFLFGLSFISVYREVFETILFYVAMWNEGSRAWLLGGVGVGALSLTVIAWLLLRTSRKLPLGKFFSASSGLIAVLAFVLTGKGVAALQEAGWVGVHVAPVPRVEWLGIYPTWQSVTAQLAVALVLAAGYAYNLRRVPAHR